MGLSRGLEPNGLDEGIEVIDNTLIEAIELRALLAVDSSICTDGAEKAGGKRGINTLEELQEEFQLTYLFISHDLSVIRHICDRIAVMYVGKLVESATVSELYNTPKHPYTEALFAAALPSRPDERRETLTLTGEVPSPLRPPSGCHFHPRCVHAMERCGSHAPSLALRDGREVACHLYAADATTAAV